MQGNEAKVYKLNNALYGLKQAPRAWNKRIDSFLIQMGFVKCVLEHGVYIMAQSESDVLLACLYVDELLVTGSKDSEIIGFKREMMSEFEISDLGELSYFLGLEFNRIERGLVMHQKKYANDLLERFNM